MSDQTVLKAEKIRKSFPGVVALDGVDFEVRKGEVHAVLGENGAGKSTLFKIITGAYRKDGGRIFLDGNEVDLASPQDALKLGISVVYQELSLFPKLTVGQNVFMGREPMKWGCINWKKLYADTEIFLRKMNSVLNPRQIVKTLGSADQQTIEITRALSSNCKLLILDEPTASLSDREIEVLFNNVENIKAAGTGIVFVTHKLDEVKRIADRVTVLRDGKRVDTITREDIDLDELIRKMVGREISQKYPPKTSRPAEKNILTASRIGRNGAVRDVSFGLRSGEILGISGLMGSGRTELVRCITGADRRDSGTIVMDGRQLKISSPRDALREGIGLLPEDRRGQGLVGMRSILENIAYTVIDRFAVSIVVRWSALRTVANGFLEKLAIRTPGVGQKTMFLSGGNQQKVVMAKWLAANCRVIIMDEPTKGIDVGAKVEMYHLMLDFVGRGNGIIMVSSELPEIVGMCHRVLVMCRGAVAGEVSGSDINAERIGKLSLP